MKFHCALLLLTVTFHATLGQKIDFKQVFSKTPVPLYENGKMLSGENYQINRWFCFAIMDEFEKYEQMQEDPPLVILDRFTGTLKPVAYLMKPPRMFETPQSVAVLLLDHEEVDRIMDLLLKSLHKILFNYDHTVEPESDIDQDGQVDLTEQFVYQFVKMRNALMNLILKSGQNENGSYDHIVRKTKLHFDL